jgi:hypothetical protein
MKNRIVLDFGSFVLDAELFDTKIAGKFAKILPVQVSLTHWGNELYGSIEDKLGEKDLGEENSVPAIPPGGIAYTSQGNYVCIFFGQRPAWAVEYIGQIIDDQWETLVANPGQASVEIRVK